MSIADKILFAILVFAVISFGRLIRWLVIDMLKFTGVWDKTTISRWKQFNKTDYKSKITGAHPQKSVKVPFSTIKFLITAKSQYIEFDKNAVFIGANDVLRRQLSFTDYLKYQSFLKQLKKQQQQRTDSENLKRVLEVVKIEQAKLEEMAARHYKQAAEIITDTGDTTP